MQNQESQTQNSVKNIFVDLDETLIHTNQFPEEPNEVPEVIVNLSEDPRKKDLYNVSLRPGANELLHALRSVGNVFMLTRATHDYAVAMNKEFNFAFTPNRIYFRRDVKSYRYKELHLPKGKNYLIDDLHELDNYEKVALISQLGPVKYIRVKEFLGFKDQGLTTSDIESIVNLITQD